MITPAPAPSQISKKHRPRVKHEARAGSKNPARVCHPVYLSYEPTEYMHDTRGMIYIGLREPKESA